MEPLPDRLQIGADLGQGFRMLADIAELGRCPGGRHPPALALHPGPADRAEAVVIDLGGARQLLAHGVFSAAGGAGGRNGACRQTRSPRPMVLQSHSGPKPRLLARGSLGDACCTEYPNSTPASP